MKHIFVTIEEFLQNGGTLTKDREIYGLSKNSKTDFNLVGYYVNYLESTEFGLHMIRTGNSTHPAAITAHYVKIKVTPIWK